MDNSRMSNADMLQYCDEALAWEDFGPIDIYFFQSVKKILLGQCSATEEPEVETDLMGIERPVSDTELEPEYCYFADIYYGEEGDDDVPDYSSDNEQYAFSNSLFAGGFFVSDEAASEAETLPSDDASAGLPGGTDAPADNEDMPAEDHTVTSEGSFTVNI